MKINYRLKPGELKVKRKQIEKQLSRYKNKSYPHIPRTSEEIAAELKKPDIQAQFGKTLNNGDKFYVDSVVTKRYSFHLFASFAVINFIKKNISPHQRFYMMDGTFRVIPKKFNQLLIISIEYKNKVCNPTFQSGEGVDMIVKFRFFKSVPFKVHI